jgi:hypothetical protein
MSEYNLMLGCKKERMKIASIETTSIAELDKSTEVVGDD